MFALAPTTDRTLLEIVPRPRAADALGMALRSAYRLPPLPDDISRLLRQLEKAR